MYELLQLAGGLSRALELNEEYSAPLPQDHPVWPTTAPGEVQLNGLNQQVLLFCPLVQGATESILNAFFAIVTCSGHYGALRP